MYARGMRREANTAPVGAVRLELSVSAGGNRAPRVAWCRLSCVAMPHACSVEHLLSASKQVPDHSAHQVECNGDRPHLRGDKEGKGGTM